MLTSQNSVSLVSAVLNAGSYAPESHDMPAAAMQQREQHRQQALDSIRMAQVDLYCDHTAEALHDIHAAETQLRHAALGRDTQDVGAALARAAWLARHHQYQEAHDELEDARTGIAMHS